MPADRKTSDSLEISLIANHQLFIIYFNIRGKNTLNGSFINTFTSIPQESTLNS